MLLPQHFKDTQAVFKHLELTSWRSNKMAGMSMASTKRDQARAVSAWYKARDSGLDGDLTALARAARQAFKKNLLHWLEFRGLTAAKLAQALGVNQSAVSNWRHGTSFPGPDLCDKIARFLNIPTFFLFLDTSDPRRDDGLLHEIAEAAEVTDPKERAFRIALVRIREAMGPAIRGDMTFDEIERALRARSDLDQSLLTEQLRTSRDFEGRGVYATERASAASLEKLEGSIHDARRGDARKKKSTRKKRTTKRDD
jgi:transcriptional regulator with XRE-family HTH domain